MITDNDLLECGFVKIAIDHGYNTNKLILTE